MSFYKVENGEPYYPTMREHYEQCCDCGLTHRVKFDVLDANGKKIKDAQVRLTVWRNEKLTAKGRKRIKIEFRST